MSKDFVETMKLRFVERDATDADATIMRKARILQQWYAEDMPAYMRDQAKGEWRDVPVGIEAP
jgi:hypothetical protein